ncbi:nuclear transport factor 2 family protein [Cryptosporangium aurantiacum]|uniref:SnoaL-like domain-containing protein n=1 Tax=Cryptosporangium aurantiacum TaxID=134849 RepID=A0A1M7K4Y3_9ACTN|nr:nuclear transport factor 2 family protein [Cryptosporangium aurantiacum]SHM60255.1 SnoaL-like domain-containing protein [Cryptosporangium aurantiacum]
MAVMSVDSTTAAWRAAGESGDAEAAAACLADTVEAISPLTAAFRFSGRDQVREMLIAAMEVFEDLRYHTEVGDERTRALFLTGRAGREQFEEAQLLRFDADGRIVELTLFGRPLPALTQVMGSIGPLLVRRQGRPGLARLIRVASAPLALFTRVGERRLVPLADPNRGRGSADG